MLKSSRNLNLTVSSIAVDDVTRVVRQLSFETSSNQPPSSPSPSSSRPSRYTIHNRTGVDVVFFVERTDKKSKVLNGAYHGIDLSSFREFRDSKRHKTRV
eukprot:GABV01001395.1.p2 GENE.GABV01001395.1~~GABV01001395.1.p2  ORF type:complete len:100 (-),score=21.62 GABV01001395.1:274-573(-)